jgi:hypothetical protein
VPYIQYVKSALWKALLATILFMISYQFYNIEFIRDKIEDFAFDTVNKFALFKKDQIVSSPHIFLFAIDDLYMKKHKLFDEDNETNYGYSFPRDQIANFILNLDELTSELEEDTYPSALFIDYDFSFTTMPYGKRLSQEDQKLVDILKQPHLYTILLPKTSKYNFIEHSSDPDIQAKIRNGSIKFVSVSLLMSNDTVRRYLSTQKFDSNGSAYISADIALWQKIRHQENNIFKKDDIIANRIIFKAYKPPVNEESCIMQQSHWETLHRYSANCSLFDIPYEDFNQSIILLGGTYTHNDDTFTILNTFGSKTFTGIDIHANTLMTLLYLNGPLKRLSLLWSTLIIFISFFLIDLIITMILDRFHIENEKLSIILLMLPSAVILFAISSYLLQQKHLWFNWSIPFVLFQFTEIIILIRQKSTKAIFKVGKLLNK